MSDGLHHLHLRRQHHKGEPYPHPVLWKRCFDYLMYGVAVVAPLALLPQVIQLYATRDASALSIPTFVLLALVNGLWITYGFIHREMPLVISSLLFSAFHLVIITGIAMYA